MTYLNLASTLAWRRRLELTAVLLLIAVMQTACSNPLGCGTVSESTREHYETIARDLPIGSTQDAILSYLERNNISHLPPTTFGEYLGRMYVTPQADVSDDNPLIEADIWGEEGPDGPKQKIVFILDDSQRLTQITYLDLCRIGL
jgi:hypothetical protein